MNKKAFNLELIAFLRNSPTPFHAVLNIRKELEDAGYQELQESNTWKCKRGGKYFVIRGGSSIAAFSLSSERDFMSGFRMVGAHTDSPCLKLKPNSLRAKLGYQQLCAEVYGGVLMNPWFDRDLSLAGNVTIRKGNKFISLPLDFKRALAVIPSLAIHLDREANSKRQINPQTMLFPIISLGNEADSNFEKILQSQIRKEHKITGSYKIVGSELSLYDFNPPAVVGLRDEFIASARLDNLLSCFVGLRALLNSGSNQNQLLICNDHEEVGSGSNLGARGTFLKALLERVLKPRNVSEVMPTSMLVSTDNAHGVHPNFPEKHDPDHLPLLNNGPVLKINQNQAYATNSETGAVMNFLAKKEGINLQSFVSRNDMGCGSTIGPLTAMTVGVKTADIGVPTFAMHSIREMAGTDDSYALYRLLKSFYKISSVEIN